MRLVDISDVKVGDVLTARGLYLRTALATFLEVGAKLGYVVWRKIEPGDKERADSSLLELSYNLIRSGDYDLAIRFLDFGVTMPKIYSDEIRRLMIVNRANAYKLSGNAAKAEEILDREDWTACGAESRISVAAVRGHVDEVVELMRQIGPEGRPDSSEYQEWPVFNSVRDDPKFRTGYEEIFGHALAAEIPED